MSKVDDLAEKAYPEGDTYIFGDASIACKVAYVKGYHQAEKDLELTWEDVREICTQSVLVEIDLGGKVSDERHYTEVLKRFKDLKK